MTAAQKSASNRAYRQKHREALNAKQSEYYKANRERLNAQRREYCAKIRESRLVKSRAYYERNSEAIRAKAQARRIKRKDWINARQREYTRKNRELIEIRKAARRLGVSQGNVSALMARSRVCAICRQPGGKKRLAIDHDHTTGMMRDRLCSRCNTGLGLFQDSEELLLRAVAYLQRFREQKGAA